MHCILQSDTALQTYADSHLECIHCEDSQTGKPAFCKKANKN